MRSGAARRPSPLGTILVLLLHGLSASASETDDCVELRVSPEASPLPPSRDAAVETLCRGAVRLSRLSVRVCPAGEPITTAELAAAVAEAHERFLADRFDEVTALLEPPVAALLDGCRPLSARADRWTPPDDAGVVHDAAAMLLWASRETESADSVNRLVRHLAAAFPEGGPSEALFPPSLRDAYAALRPATPPAAVAVAPTGCDLAVNGRVVGGGAWTAHDPIVIAVRCGGEGPWRLEIEDDPTRLQRLARPWEPPGPVSLAETVARLALRWESAETVVLVAPAPEASVVAVRRSGGRTAVLPPHDPSRWAGLLARLAPPGMMPSPDDARIGPAGMAGVLGTFLGSGLLLAAGGGWALHDAAGADVLAERAATQAERDRLAGARDDLTATGWALVGVGVAMAVGAAVWLGIELADGEEPDAEPETAVRPWLVPGAAGLGVVF